MIWEYPDLDGAEQAAMNVLWDYNRMVSHVLDKVWIVATCIGTILWSLAAWPHGRGWKMIGGVGIAVSVVGLVGLAAGQFRMNVTGVGLFVFGLAAWMIGVGALLCRSSTTH